MPNYDYRCTKCGLEFEMQTTIAERDMPTLVPCVVCEANDGIADDGQEQLTIERYLPTPPGFGDPMRLGRKRAPDAFNDLLKNMKTKHRHNTINTR